MLSVWYILILNIYAMKLTRCVHMKNINSKKEDLRVVGGRDALPGEYPYVLGIAAEIIKKKSSVIRLQCTCACIKPTWSLTAAHCIIYMESLKASRKTNNILLRYNPSLTEVAFVKVLSMVMIPNSRLHDIGILKSGNIFLSTYARVSSVDYFTLYGLKVTAVGYGLMLDDHGEYNDTFSLNKPLQVMDAMIIKCVRRFPPTYCLAGPCEKFTHVLHGDSGGPVIHSSGIVGIIRSNRIKYRRYVEAGIITPVSPFIDWILNISSQNI